MIFFLVYIFLFFGIMLVGMGSFLPPDMPIMLNYLLFIMGIMIVFVGMIILQTRASKTGAIHLLEFGRPNTIIWFYVHRDGTVKITSAMREIEGQLYSKELDAQIHDLKSYRLFDHSIRFVPEGIGHAADLDMCLYATLLKTKFGLNNIREARRASRFQILNKFPFNALQKQDVVSQEKFVAGGENIGKTQ